MVRKVFVIAIALAFVSCSMRDAINSGDSSLTNDMTRCPHQKEFTAFLDSIRWEGYTVDYKTLSQFLPDSLKVLIPKQNWLLAESKAKVNNRVVVKINSNGKKKGEILLCCFSDCGDLINYMVIQRYCDEGCERVFIAREIMIVNDTSGFEFYIDETEYLKNTKPIFRENQYKREKWYLNDYGIFEASK